MNKIRSTKGITLISLVVTIIVLIILAGVSINLLLGENGLFNTAKKAGEDYIKSGLKEELEAEIINIQSKKIANGEELKREDLNELTNIGATMESCEIPATGEYKNQLFEINEKYEVKILDKKADKENRLYLYNYGDTKKEYSSGWNYIGGRFYSGGQGATYVKHNKDNIELYYGGCIGTELKEDYLENYKYLCIKFSSEVTRNEWTQIAVRCSKNFESYTDAYQWLPILSYYEIVGQKDYNIWKEYTAYINLKEELNVKSRYLNINFCEGRDGYIYQIYLTNEEPKDISK